METVARGERRRACTAFFRCGNRADVVKSPRQFHLYRLCRPKSGAIVEPWCEYRKEGNSYFFFLLGLMFAVLLLAGLMLASVIGLGWLKQGAGETGSITSIGFLVFLGVFWVSIVIFVSIATYFMVPVMYRRRCRAIAAFRDVTRLIWHHLGSFSLLCLFEFVLILAVLLIGAIVTCATCCLAALPYLGTVILLPLFVCLRAFGLVFLRQFGPDYDVWMSSMPPEPPLASTM
jgi:hypothetical protein